MRTGAWETREACEKREEKGKRAEHEKKGQESGKKGSCGNERSLGKKVGAWEKPENVGKRQSWTSEKKSGVKEKGYMLQMDNNCICIEKKVE